MKKDVDGALDPWSCFIVTMNTNFETFSFFPGQFLWNSQGIQPKSQ